MDRYNAQPATTQSPIRFAVAPTLSDGAPGDIVDPPSCIYVGVSGDVAMSTMDDTGLTAVVFKAMAVGWHPVRPRRIWATNTTATNILLGYA